jgi:FixJ family two-component response regulator
MELSPAVIESSIVGAVKAYKRVTTDAVITTTESSVRVLVVDDHGPTRELLHTYLAGRGYRVKAAATADEVLAEDELDVVVLDVGLGPDSGWDLAAKLAARTPEVALIFLTGLGGIEHKAFGFELGAEDYLVKPVTLSELDMRLTVAIRNLLARRAASGYDDAGTNVPITHREREVLEAVSRGTTNKAIAFELGISERTVKFHLASLMRKHAVKTRTALVAVAGRAPVPLDR